MIALQRLNGQPFYLNADLIETVESTPDTVIKLSNGKTYIAKDSLEDVIRKTVKYKQLCHQVIQVVHRSDQENDVRLEKI